MRQRKQLPLGKRHVRVDGFGQVVFFRATLERRPGLLMGDLRQATGIDDVSAMRFGAAAGRMGDWGGVLALWRPADPVRYVLSRCGLDDLVTPLEVAPVLMA